MTNGSDPDHEQYLQRKALESVDLVEGPDATEVRRHVKRLYSASEYDRLYRKLLYYKPNRGQLRFHNSQASEVQLLANNQGGKSLAAAAQMAMDALGFYPGWYAGAKHVVPNIIRPVEFVGWVASTTSEMTRDIDQARLLGDLTQRNGLGTGMIPLDHIVGKPLMARGISTFVDQIALSRINGKAASISFKTYAQGRQSFQGDAVDRILLDEQLPREQQDIYGECLARLSTTRGRIYSVMTPLLGKTEQRKRFDAPSQDREIVRMTIDDVEHIPPDEIARIKQRYSETEAPTRLYGVDAQGEGAALIFDEANCLHTLSLGDVPAHWFWLQGVDFQHAGLSQSAHPFGYVMIAWDKDADTIYVLDAWKIRGALPANHVERIMARDVSGMPVSWPHDGHRQNLKDGVTIARMYKALGLAMRPIHATHKDGGYSYEASLLEIQNRLTAGKLKIAKHLQELWNEIRNLHRENGEVVKVDDDIFSALRVAIMDRRFAVQLTARNSAGGFMASRRQGSTIAKGIDDWDIFTGR